MPSCPQRYTREMVHKRVASYDVSIHVDDVSEPDLLEQRAELRRIVNGPVVLAAADRMVDRADDAYGVADDADHAGSASGMAMSNPMDVCDEGCARQLLELQILLLSSDFETSIFDWASRFIAANIDNMEYDGMTWHMYRSVMSVLTGTDGLGPGTGVEDGPRVNEVLPVFYDV